MSNTRRIGRGLDALWSVSEPSIDNEKIDAKKSLAIELLAPNPNQPRRTFSDEGLNELATSIKEQGIIQPILVRDVQDGKKFEIIAGERRYRAALIVGLSDVPVYIVSMTDEEVMAAALIENIQREDLNPIEEALAIQRLRDECKITQDQLAKKLGKSRSALANTLRLLQLPEHIQQSLSLGQIQAGHARTLLSLENNSVAQNTLFNAIQDKQLSVREAEAAVNYFKENAAFPFEVKNSDTEVDATQAVDSIEDTTQEKEHTKSPKRKKSPYLKNLQSTLKTHLNVKASISGSEDRGRITLTYTNADELMKLLLRMGIESDDDAQTDLFPVKQ